MPDLLYEIGTEELPAAYLEPALAALAQDIERRLAECRLTPRASRTAGTPRRMAVAVEAIPERQPRLRTRVMGPPARAAYDAEGNPTSAARGFARSKGVPVEALQVEQTDRGPYAVASIEEPGQLAAAILPELLHQATSAVPFPKSMRWEQEGFPFARPIRWLVALLDDQVLPLTIAGVQAGRTTRGHPFLSPQGVELADASFERYLAALRERHVIADIAERRRIIRTEINAILERHGSELTEHALLNEVADMVEWPHAVEGAFDPHFLDVPAPVLIAAMKEHQRYFPVRDAAGRLLPRFIAISNRTAGQDAQVRRGNENVLLARLADARFFYEQDSRRGLEQFLPRLEGVVFLGGLGNNLQRTERLQDLAGCIAEAMGPGVSLEHVRRAARLCKADLVSGLVGEFPSLQGIVGGELARASGEPLPVAEAIAEHYRPAGSDDALPSTLEGCALALADRLDVLIGCFSVGLLPSGSQDPYALRRNALGIALIIEGRGLPLRLSRLVDMARTIARRHGIECDDAAAARIGEFFRDRLYHAAVEKGFRHDFVRAVLAAGHDDVKAFWDRLSALAECAGRSWWPALVELVDRTYRIHRDAESIGAVEESLLTEPLERQLAAVLRENQGAVAALLDSGRYVEGAERYCSAFARLVHDFFEEVFVNVEDMAVRANRKSLCGWVYHLFADRFADLYQIEVPRSRQ